MTFEPLQLPCFECGALMPYTEGFECRACRNKQDLSRRENWHPAGELDQLASPRAPGLPVDDWVARWREECRRPVASEHVMCRCCGTVWHASDPEPRHRTPLNVPCSGQNGGYTQEPHGYCWEVYVREVSTRYAPCPVCGARARLKDGRLAYHHRTLPLGPRQRKPRTEKCPGTGEVPGG